MKMRTLASIAVLLAAACSWAASSMDGCIRTSDPSGRAQGDADAHGNVAFAVKVTTKNDCDGERSVQLVMQGVDKDGYEIAKGLIYGDVPAKSSVIVTGSVPVKASEAGKIVAWQVSMMAAIPDHVPKS